MWHSTSKLISDEKNTLKFFYGIQLRIPTACFYSSHREQMVVPQHLLSTLIIKLFALNLMESDVGTGWAYASSKIMLGVNSEVLGHSHIRKGGAEAMPKE